MKLTPRLLKQNKVRWFNHLWKTKLPRSQKMHLVNDPERSPLTKLGITVHKIDDVVNPPKEKWVPPDDPRFWKYQGEEEAEHFHEQPAYMYLQGRRLIEGIKQAQNLTKTVLMEGTPKGVQDMMGYLDVPDKENLLQQYILQSQKWDPTEDRLPKRIDIRKVGYKFGAQYGIPREKSMHTLLTNLCRLGHMTMCKKHPDSVLQRKMLVRPKLKAQYQYNGKEVLIQTTPDFMFFSETPMQNFASQSDVQKTADMSIEGMYPVLPTIDLVERHIYVPGNLAGFKKKEDVFCTSIHSIYFKSNFLNPSLNHAQQAQNLMMAFACTIAQAKQMYGENVGDLKKPISIQCISCSETTLNFVYFQLNTLNISEPGGIKNMVWLDSKNELFNKILSEPWKHTIRNERKGGKSVGIHSGLEFLHDRYTDLQVEPLDKLLASMAYGHPSVCV